MKKILISALAVLLAIQMVGCASEPVVSELTTAIDSYTNAEDSDTEALNQQTSDNSGSALPTVLSPEIENLSDEQRNSFAMLYYLAFISEEIRSSHDNKLILNDIYDLSINYINPSAIDKRTQEQLDNLRKTIKEYLEVNTKRERLNFIYNQSKAKAIRSAIPNPVSVLAITRSADWKKVAAAVLLTAADSYRNYRNTADDASNEFLMNGWELDDQELAAIQSNRENAFNYMIDIVNEYHLDGLKTLNEKDIERFVEIQKIENLTEKIQRFKSEEQKYELLGVYWLELADCYYETNQYRNCIDCVDIYKKLSTGIYRKDSNYAKILPKIIIAAQSLYEDSEYVTIISKYADDIIQNTETDDWAARYFAAQIYNDLFDKTNDSNYLNKAYDIAKSNVTVLKTEQRKLNNTYLNDVVEVTISEPDYRYMTEKQKKEKEKEYKAEKERLKKYNKELKENRKTELSTLYEPLLINCDLLFALAEKKGISDEEKKLIEDILETSSNGTFLINIANDRYSFSNKGKHYSVEMSKDGVLIPANILTSGSKIVITVTDGSNTETFDDCVVSKVERNGSTVDTFIAHVTSDKLSKYKWTETSRVNIRITYEDIHDETKSFDFYVFEIIKHDKWYNPHDWFTGDEVIFRER